LNLERVERRLTAILTADVPSYSRLVPATAVKDRVRRPERESL